MNQLLAYLFPYAQSKFGALMMFASAALGILAFVSAPVIKIRGLRGIATVMVLAAIAIFLLRHSSSLFFEQD